MKRITVSALMLTAALGLSGCGGKKSESVPVQGVHDKSSATIIDMPSRFPSVAVKCDGWNRVYVVDDGGDNKRAGIAVAVNDAQCIKQRPNL